MPPSEHEQRSELSQVPPGQRLAVVAESLYLINLLLVPGPAFAVLVWLLLRNREAPPLARCHLRQTVAASLWSGGLLGVFSIAVIVVAGYEMAHTWVFVVLYVITVHSMFVLLGMLGLARAMAGRHFRYPLFGMACDEVKR